MTEEEDLPDPCVTRETNSGSAAQSPRERAAKPPIRVGNLVLIPGDPRIVIGERVLFLSPQHLALLQLLAEQAGRVVDTKTLGGCLARSHKPLAGVSVAVHIHNLRGCLKATGLSIRTVRGVGYVLEPGGRAAPR